VRFKCLTEKAANPAIIIEGTEANHEPFSAAELEIAKN
jgi:hypothetical protein